MADWEIKKTLGQCYETGREFALGEQYYAALVEIETGQLERRDYSADCWERDKPAVYCFWKTKMPDSQQKKKLFIDDEMLMAFFERLTEETEQEKVNFRFVLTLVLMRKRKLKYESSDIKDGAEIWTLRITGGDQRVQVVNPNLTEDEIEQLSSQMGQILQVDFDG